MPFCHGIPIDPNPFVNFLLCSNLKFGYFVYFVKKECVGHLDVATGASGHEECVNVQSSVRRLVMLRAHLREG